MFPKQHRGSLFVAEHGSWRLKRKGDIGHRVGTPAHRSTIVHALRDLSLQ